MDGESVQVNTLWDAVQDARLIVASIGICGVVLGAAATTMFKARYDLRQERRLREQRQRDLAMALHAEILAGVGASGWQLTQEEYDYALANPSPFATPDDNDFVFQNAVKDLSVLPERIIHSVVRYYRLAAQSNALTRELRSPSFASQDHREREKFMKGMMLIIDLQRAAGEQALIDIQSYVERAKARQWFSALLQGKNEPVVRPLTLIEHKDKAGDLLQAARKRQKDMDQMRRMTLAAARAKMLQGELSQAEQAASDDWDDGTAHDVSPDGINISSKGAE